MMHETITFHLFVNKTNFHLQVFAPGLISERGKLATYSGTEACWD